MNLFASLFASLGGAMSQTLITVLIGLGIFGAGYLNGVSSERNDQVEANLKTVIAYAERLVEVQNEADQLTEENTRLRSAQAPKDRIITREVTRYEFVTPPGLRCLLPGTWRVRHDMAATGDPAHAEAGPLAAPAADPVTDTAALETVAINYTACRAAIAQVEGWQRRYQTIEAPTP